MSIKSQKSLNDECSEIFEKSYSVKSGSEESWSCDEEDTLPHELLMQLTPAVLSRLRKHFRRCKAKSGAIDKRVEDAMRTAAAEEGIEFPEPPEHADDLTVDHQGFIEALQNIFGGHKYTSHAQKLVQALDPFGRGRVGWASLVARLARAGVHEPALSAERWVPAPAPRVLKLQHCKRETIVRLVSIERDETFCYAAVSRGGRVGVYGGDLNMLSSYQIFYHRTGMSRRVKNCWITDAVYMSDVQCLTYSASDRSLTVYDAVTLSHAPLFCLTGLPNIPTCLAYCPAAHVVDSSDLLFGSEHGELTRLRFLRPRVTLLPVRSPDHINTYFWMELSSPEVSAYCSASTWRAHSRAVRRLACERDGVVVSCSHEAHCSLRLRRGGLLPDYVYVVPRGITCFHVVMSLQLLATGSPDGILRLWGTTGGAPHARLQASAAVLDVAIVAASEVVVAFCANTSVHIWDVYEECLLQTIKINFPFLGVLGKKVEFGVYCLHPGPPRQTSESDYLETGEESGRAETAFDRGGRCELLVSSCDALGVLALMAPVWPVRAAPADTLRARRPSYWELPGDCLTVTAVQPPQPPSLPPPASPQQPAPAPDESAEGLNDLLEKAGLQGILEKDFVLMKGLKHDLNSKLHELEAKMTAMRSLVSLGAPFLALRSCELEPLPTFERLMAASDRIMRSYPDSTLATPTGSERSTPRVQSFHL